MAARHRKLPKQKRRSRGSSSRELIGVLQVSRRGKAQVATNLGVYQISARDMREALHGDTVRVVPKRDSGRRARGGSGRGGRGEARWGIVVGVIKRAVTTFVARYDELSDLHIAVAVPVNPRITRDFLITTRPDFKVSDGDIVEATIDVFPTSTAGGKAFITRLIARANDPDAQMLSLIADYGFEPDFAPEVLATAGEQVLDVAAALADTSVKRRDLRHLDLITIDPVDSRDFDDALSLECLKAEKVSLKDSSSFGGHSVSAGLAAPKLRDVCAGQALEMTTSDKRRKPYWRLGVHIADVSHYVAHGSTLDREAKSRATSVYLADRVLPMLPPALSDELCSLKPDEDRLAMSVMIDLDKHGELCGAAVFPSVIRSRARLDYDGVNALLLASDKVVVPQGAAVQQGAIAQGGTPLDEIIKTAKAQAPDLLDVSLARLKRGIEALPDLPALLGSLDSIACQRGVIRRNRGALDFETQEAHVLLDENNEPLRVQVKERTRATQLVEEAMLLANECVAQCLLDCGVGLADTALLPKHLPALFRSHKEPDADKLLETYESLRMMNLLPPDNTTIEGLLKGSPFAVQRVLEIARGRPGWVLVNALMLRSMMRATYTTTNDGHYALGALAYLHFTSPIRRYPDLTVHRAVKALLPIAAPLRRFAVDELDLACSCAACESLADHCSERERAAASLSLMTQRMMLARYYESRIGTREEGLVVGVMGGGLFVRLSSTIAEVFVCRADVLRYASEHDYIDAELLMGARVIVMIESVDTEQGTIDASLYKCVRTL